MEHYIWHLKQGIGRNHEYARKLLATHSRNAGLICGHDCAYCPTRSCVRTHRAFKELGVKPFTRRYAIVDPDTPVMVARDISKLGPDDILMVCPTTDAWAPEAQKYKIGKRILEVVAERGQCQCRLLSKNRAMFDDLDVVKAQRGRFMVGTSITAPARKAAELAAVERYASPNPDRREALVGAHRRGYRTFGMLSPVLPGIVENGQDMIELFNYIMDANPGDIWVEPVNARGPGLIWTAEDLRSAGYTDMAAAVDRIRKRDAWQEYAFELTRHAQAAAAALGLLDKVHVLLYQNRFDPALVAALNEDELGIVWL